MMTTTAPLLVSEPLVGARYRAESVRWPDHDYAAAGWTFVTVCTAGRTPFFGSVSDGVVQLSRLGQIADEAFRAVPDHGLHVVVDALVVMPDHLHVLLGLTHRPDAEAGGDAEETRHGVPLRPNAPPHSVEARHGASSPTPALSPTPATSPTPTWTPAPAPPAAPRTFGGLAAGSIPSIVNQAKGAVTRAARRAGHTGFRWQPGYHDRVVRSERELDHARRYIANNPARWTAR